MSRKRLKGKSQELLLARSNHLSFVIAIIIAFTLGVMPLIALYLMGDIVTESIFAVLLFTFILLIFVPLVTGIYRMAGLAYEHKEFGIVDVFFAFSSVKNYLYVLLINILGIIKLLIPILTGFICYVILAVILKNVGGAVWIAAISAVGVGAITLPLTKRFYAVSFLICVEDMGFIGAIKQSVRYTKKKSIKLALLTVGFLPFTVLSVIALMVPFVIYIFPFRLCLYSVICGELKSEFERENERIEKKNDICSEPNASDVEEINEQDS